MSKFSKHNREFLSKQGKPEHDDTKKQKGTSKEEKTKKEKFKKFRYGLSLKNE